MMRTRSIWLALRAPALAFVIGCGTTTTTVIPDDKGPGDNKQPDPGKSCDTTADCQTRFGEGWICENKVCENVVERDTGPTESEPTVLPGIPLEAQDAFREGVQAALSVPPEYDKALASFEKAAELSPSFLEAYFNIGTVHEKAGNTDKALDAYQRAIKANPESADAKAFVGKVFLAKGKALLDSGKGAEAERLFSKAKLTFDEVVARDFENVPANNGLALYHLLKGDTALAEDHVKQVLIIEPENVTALNTRGLVFLKAGQLNFAEWIFKQKVIGLDPNSVEAHTNLGTVYVRTNQLPLAVQHFSVALKLDPGNVAAHLNLGKIYLEYLNYEGARDRFESALKLEPENVEAISGLGTCQLGLNQLEAAIKSYDKTVELDGRRASLFEEIGKLYEKKGTKDDVCKQAVGYYEKYIKAGQLPPTHEVSKRVLVLKDACAQGLYDVPAEEPKLPEEGAPAEGEPAAEPKAEPAAEPAAEPKAEPAAEPKPETKPEPAPAPAPEPAAEPKVEPAVEPTPGNA